VVGAAAVVVAVFAVAFELAVDVLPAFALGGSAFCIHAVNVTAATAPRTSDLIDFMFCLLCRVDVKIPSILDPKIY
jgi:hypothetical protein